KFGIIDAIVPEPSGGAHRDPETTIGAVGDALRTELATLANLSRDQLATLRAEKFMAIGKKV
ncbi:MAG TPA: acetyl-CoA carboxylase carboxyl transferase subunit alpha, partial [Methylocystis sp.]|nr:acetyl-CoA carboxylase carboxyl transferase subunit alpha [Methylocystis sp.]